MPCAATSSVAAAVKAGKFAAEIAPLTVKKGKKEFVVDTDDHIKPETTLEVLGKLRPAFGKEGTVTAGNASGIVDGAAMLVVTTAQQAKEFGLQPKAKIRSWGIAGVEPEIMGIGPVPAIQQACEKAELKVADLDLIEINEAFSAQYLGLREGAEARPRQVQRQRGGDCARTPARGDGIAAVADAAA